MVVFRNNWLIIKVVFIKIFITQKVYKVESAVNKTTRIDIRIQYIVKSEQTIFEFDEPIIFIILLANFDESLL